MSFGFSVGDFIAVGELAWSLYQNCYKVARGAPAEFQLLLQELSTLSNSLRMLTEEVRNPESILSRAGEDRVILVNGMIYRIKDTLKKLEKIGTKYEILAESSRKKHIWLKVQWSLEHTSVDRLRNKFVQHNTELTLLLTCAGNSSLQRIEKSTRALETDLAEIRDYIKASSRGSQMPHLSSFDAELEDDVFRAALTNILMTNAEVIQPWNTIEATRWIHTGRWWLLKAQVELHDQYAPRGRVPLQAYANLIKASWILIDIISGHPQQPFLDAATSFEVQLLSTEIKKEFKQIEQLNLDVPPVSTMEEEGVDLAIWETQTRVPMARLSRQSDAQQTLRLVIDGEQTYFQRFAEFHLDQLTKPVPCVVIFTVNDKTLQARLIAQDQSHLNLLEIYVSSGGIEGIDDCRIVTKSGDLVFTNRDDFRWICSVLEVAGIYLIGQKGFHGCLDEFKILNLISAVVYGCRSAMFRFLEDPIFRSPDPIARAAKEWAVSRLHISFTQDDSSSQDFQEHWAKESSQAGHQNRDSKSESLFEHVVQDNQNKLAEYLLKFQNFTVLHEDGDSYLAAALQNQNDGVIEALAKWSLRLHLEDVGWAHASQRVRNAVLERMLTTWLEKTSSKICDVKIFSNMLESLDEVLKKILKEGRHAGEDNEKRLRLLHNAADTGEEMMAILLVESGADVDAMDNQCRTPLHLALSKGHCEVAKLLIDADANINRADVDGTTPLHIVAMSGDISMAAILIQNNVDLNTRKLDGTTPLLTALIQSHYRLAQLLIDVGADVTTRHEMDYTPLHFTAIHGSPEIARSLIDQGANINAIDTQGNTSLHLAALNRKLDLAEVLVQHDADVNISDGGGLTALHRAAFNGAAEIVALLTRAGSDLFFKSVVGKTALHYAIIGRHPSVAEILLNHERDVVDLTDSNGWTPLHLAASIGDGTILELLLCYGPKLENRDKFGETPLLVAAQEKKHEAIDILIAHGADSSVLESKTGSYHSQPLEVDLQLATEDRITHGVNEDKAQRLLALQTGRRGAIYIAKEDACDSPVNAGKH